MVVQHLMVSKTVAFSDASQESRSLNTRTLLASAGGRVAATGCSIPVHRPNAITHPVDMTARPAVSKELENQHGHQHRQVDPGRSHCDRFERDEEGIATNRPQVRMS